jgi:hypothetical protein
MAKKISELPDSSAATGTELLPVVQSGVTVKMVLSTIKNYLQSTPPQFDNSTAIATTEFVKRSGLTFNSWLTYANSASIPASACGRIIQVAPLTNVITLTLPSAASCPSGSALIFKHTGEPYKATIVRSGSDSIICNHSSTQIDLGVGADAILISNGIDAWFLFSGSTALHFTEQFRRNLATNGYQKLPGGLIIQWGTVTAIPNNVTGVAFPITFPNACLSAVANSLDSHGATYRINAHAFVQTGMSIANTYTSSMPSAWIAIGY